MREALTDNPGSTTATLAMAAGIGKSTAAKILARWERDGTAIRTADDGPRNPTTWALTTPDRDAATPQAEDTQPDATETPGADSPTDRASDTVDDNEEDTGSVDEAITADRDTLSSDANAEDDATTPLPDTARADKHRLRKGGLRALVEEYLTEHPDESFGPPRSARTSVTQPARSTTPWKNSPPTGTPSKPARRRSGSPSIRPRPTSRQPLTPPRSAAATPGQRYTATTLPVRRATDATAT